MFDKLNLYSKLKKIYCSDVKQDPKCDEDQKALALKYSQQRLVTVEKLKDLTNYLEKNRYTLLVSTFELHD